MSAPAQPAEPAVLVERDGPVRILTLNRAQRRHSLTLDDRIELLAAEAAEQLELLTGADFAEGRAAFAQRRPSHFTQPRPDGTARQSEPAR